MKKQQPNTTPDLKSDDIMKCVYLDLARRNRAGLSYIYSLVILRDETGKYPMQTKINVETFQDKKRADLAYNMKNEIMRTQYQMPFVQTMMAWCEGAIKNFRESIR